MPVGPVSRVVIAVACAALLHACGGGGAGGADSSAAIDVPVAVAGATQSVVVGATVRLDGSKSSDARGDALSFNWSFKSRPAGSTAALSQSDTATPSFVADVAGTYVVTLIVSDGKSSSTESTVSVTVSLGNAPPVADAGADLSVVAGKPVTLDGSKSSDSNADAITYAWTLSTLPAGSAAALGGATTAAPSFTPDVVGTYVATLIVNDGKADSTADSVAIGVSANAVPVADAGSAHNVVTGSTVNLDGSTSSDGNGDTLSYQWSLTTRPAGSSATLSSTTSPTPSFTADLTGQYIAQLIVDDGVQSSAAATVTVTAAPANVAPVADAGAAQNVVAGDLVSLDGSGSSDANGDTLAYAWSFVSRPTGSAAALSSATARKPTFTADQAGTYVLQLIVDDGTLDSAASTVTITAAVANVAPVANAGADQFVLTGSVVALDGSASSDANGDMLSYGWTLQSKPAGSTAALSSATASQPTFTADKDGAYVVKLKVNDGQLDSAQDTLTVTAQQSMLMACADGAGVQCSGTTGIRVENNALLLASGVAVFGRSSVDSTPTGPIGLAPMSPGSGSADVRVKKAGAGDNRTVTDIGLVLDNLGITWDGTTERPVIVDSFGSDQGRTSLVNGAVVQEPFHQHADVAFYDFASKGPGATQANYANNRYFPRDQVTEPSRCPPDFTPCPTLETPNPLTFNLHDSGATGSQPDTTTAFRFHEDGDVNAGDGVAGATGPGVPFPGSKGVRAISVFSYRYGNFASWFSQDTVEITDWGASDEHNQDRIGVVAFGDVTDPATIPAAGTATYKGYLYGTYAPDAVQDRGDIESTEVTLTVDFASRTVTLAVANAHTAGEGVSPAALAAMNVLGNATLGTAREANYATGAVSSAAMNGFSSLRFFGPTAAGAPPEVGGTIQVNNPATGATGLAGFVARKE